MRLTNEQKRSILPYVQAAVQGVIDSWEAESHIESTLGLEIDDMHGGLEDLAISADSGADVTIDQMQWYIDSCRIIGED